MIALTTQEKEFDEVAYMLDQANKHGLLIEVVWSALNAAGTITERCESALREWDI